MRPLLALLFLSLVLVTKYGGNAPLIRGVVLLYVDCWTLIWVGMWNALTSSTFNRAVFASYWRVMVPSWAVLGLGYAVYNRGGLVYELFLWIWFMGCVIYDVMLAISCEEKLRMRFRAVVADDPCGQERLGTGDRNWPDLITD